jgi:hypothetical protein
MIRILLSFSVEERRRFRQSQKFEFYRLDAVAYKTILNLIYYSQRMKQLTVDRVEADRDRMILDVIICQRKAIRSH